MELLLIGLSHKTTPLALREQLYLAQDQLSSFSLQMAKSIPVLKEHLVVSTCNRFEIYIAGESISEAISATINYIAQFHAIDAESLQSHLYIYQNEAAVKHLMRVTCSLDSMILGETQILGQISQAFKQAQSIQVVGAMLSRLFSEAIHVGKRCHTETNISKHTISISHAAITLAKPYLEATGRVMLIGAGEMAKEAIVALQSHHVSNIDLYNRTYEHGQQLAHQYGIQAYQWSQLWECLPGYQVVFTATGAPHTMIEAIDLARVLRPDQSITLVDVAVPRDVDVRVRELPNVTYFDIDDLQQVVDSNRAQRHACIPDAETLIQEAADKFMTWWLGRKVVPIIRGLRQQVEGLAQSELQTTLQQLEHLSEADKAIIHKLTHRIVNKILHSPTTNLREHAIQADADTYAQIVCELFSLTTSEQVQHG